MNIKITYNWLRDFLDTDADPYEIQKYLSLTGAGIERVDQVGDDYVMDIEITTNRVDMASVLGIAQEAQAVLPLYGKKAKIKNNPLEQYSFDSLETSKDSLPLTVKITDPSLVSRFTAIVLSNVAIRPSPETISQRLQMCEIKSINNVVDVSNYLMLSLGQPTHIFDYDGIGKATMIVRESKKGEKIKTLDEKEFTLPGGDIVIEDGNGDIVDLCGIMGGHNSSVKNSTKNIVLFVQTYEKKHIRKTSMTTGQRTVAATYFEKGLDEERVEPTLAFGVELLKKNAGATIASKLYDIYPAPYKTRIILISQEDIDKIIGVAIEPEKVVSILSNLGFETQKKTNNTYQIMVPSWRNDDIEIKEDIIEEVARVYGYHNLPNNIQSTTFVNQPKELATFFTLQSKTKYLLKHIGLHETMNYSMVSKELLESLDLKVSDHLGLQNTISEEIRYFRKSLIPSLVKNISDNEGRKEVLKFFEIAKVYLPKKADLPDEQYRLTLAVNTTFFDLKGIVETILKELHISNYSFKKGTNHYLSENMQTELLISNQSVGHIGQLKPTYQNNNNIKSDVYMAELDFPALISHYRVAGEYSSPKTFAEIKLDLTLQTDKNFEEIKNTALATSKLLTRVEYIGSYNENKTFRFYFYNNSKNITENEAKVELDSIKSSL